MHFGFALELSDIDLWNIDLLDTHLGLLNPEISIQISPASILFVSIKSLRGLQDMSSRHLQDMSSRRLQDMSSRRLQDVFSVTIFRLPRRLEDVLKMSSRRLARGLENVFKTSSRRLGRRKIVTLKTCWRRLQDMSWRRLQDVFKTNKCLVGIYYHLITIWRNTDTFLEIFVGYNTNSTYYWAELLRSPL